MIVIQASKGSPSFLASRSDPSLLAFCWDWLLPRPGRFIYPGGNFPEVLFGSRLPRRGSFCTFLRRGLCVLYLRGHLLRFCWAWPFRVHPSCLLHRVTVRGGVTRKARARVLVMTSRVAFAGVCLQSHCPLNVMGAPGAVGDPLTAFLNNRGGAAAASAVRLLVNPTLPAALFL